MQYHAPSSCPVCKSTMAVTRLHCDKCNSELTGAFTPCRFCMLQERHLQFVEAFLRCRGNIKEVEKALGVSYPTVRNMMDAALDALGLSAKEAEGKTAAALAREDILEKLARREIDMDTALALLEQQKDQ